MDLKLVTLRALASLRERLMEVNEVKLGDDRCTAIVLVQRITFNFLAGDLAAKKHHEMPIFTIFVPELRSVIVYLEALGYNLRVAEFQADGGRFEYNLEVTLQLWDGGGAILSLKLTDNLFLSEEVDSFLAALRMRTVTLGRGCSIIIRGYDRAQRILQTTKTFLGPDFQYVLVEGAQHVLVKRDQRDETEWTLYLPRVGLATGHQIVSLSSIPGDVPGEVTDYAKIEVQILAPHQE